MTTQSSALARGAAQGNLAALLLTLLGVLAVPLSGDAQAIASHAGHVAHASPTDSAPEAAFVGAARAATARYRDIAVARADGYRRVGGELPSLGEHWVHNGRALADTLDPAAPPILVYASIDGRTTLAGVAYTRFLAAAEAYPDFPRGIAHAWHDHNGGVDDEVLPLGHVAGAPSATPSTRLRIAVMHAWIWIANPGGLWASDNWGLPYARLGLPSDAGDGGADARALSLASGGEAYYLSAIVSVGGLQAAERERVGRILSDYGARATTIAAALARGHDVLQYVVSRADRDALALLWTSMWDEIARSVRPDVAARLVPLRDALTPASVRR